jgi:ADP-ribosyl-[dinitrogen reductase] hydrolase
MDATMRERPPDLRGRARGCAVGAAVGDAVGMPLEFGSRRPPDRMVREMRSGRLPAGTFTDDTEMALALAEGLLALALRGLAHEPLDLPDLAERFVAWYEAGPEDIGYQTRLVLHEISRGAEWDQASKVIYRAYPDSAGNGSVMRCWPVALARWDDLDRLLADSRRQSEVTHRHPECVAACAFVNATIYELLQGTACSKAVEHAVDAVDMPEPLRAAIRSAPDKTREELPNSGWVRHTTESAVWGLLTTGSFEEAIVQVANLGGDADSAAAVAGALAGAAYGLDAIPPEWQEKLKGSYPLESKTTWNTARLVDLADRLVEMHGG